MQTYTSSAAADADTPGFGEYFGIIKKRKRWLFIVGAPIVAIAALLAVGLPDVYRSAGLIEIEKDAASLNNVARDAEDARYADQYVQSLSTIVLGGKSLTRLLTEHRLYDDQGEIDSALIKRVREDIDVDIVTVPILDPNTGREREIVSAFSVAYNNQDPERAQEGAAWLVEAFLAQNRSDRQGYAANAAQFFAAEAERVRKDVANIEARLSEFKSKNAGRLPDLENANISSMDRAENDLRNVETQMQALRRERVFLAAQLQQAQSAAPESVSLRQLEDEYRQKSASYDESHPDMISLRRSIDTMKRGGSVAGMSLREQLQQQRSILDESRQRYSDDHPDVKRIMRNIESLEARIASGETSDRSVSADSPMAVQLRTQLNATDTQLAALQTRATELRAKLNDLEGRLTTAPEVEREFQAVTRDLTSARAKYQELLQRQMDAEVSEAAIAGGTADRFRVASNPSTPENPAKPQRIAIFAVGIILAMIASITSIILAQLFDQTVRGVRDIRDILDVTPLTAVPVIQQSRSRFGKRALLPFARTASSVAAVGLTWVAASFFI